MIIQVTDTKAVFGSFISEKTDNIMAKEKEKKTSDDLQNTTQKTKY